MPNSRISMTNLKRLIELQSSNLTVREMAAALSMSSGAVSKYLTAIRAAGLTAQAAASLSEAELERRVFGEKTPAAPAKEKKAAKKKAAE